MALCSLHMEYRLNDYTLFERLRHFKWVHMINTIVVNGWRANQLRLTDLLVLMNIWIQPDGGLKLCSRMDRQDNDIDSRKRECVNFNSHLKNWSKKCFLDRYIESSGWGICSEENKKIILFPSTYRVKTQIETITAFSVVRTLVK